MLTKRQLLSTTFKRQEKTENCFYGKKYIVHLPWKYMPLTNG